MRPSTGPFADLQERSQTPPIRPSTAYSLSDSYTEDHIGAAPPYNGYHERMNTEYVGTPLNNPSQGYGGPDRASSPDSRSSEQDSLEAWKQRQAPGGPGIRRYQTRKVKLQQGSVLSVEYPVPSAIQNSVQAKYRNDLESGSEEFTHMRCIASYGLVTKRKAAADGIQILLPHVTLMTLL